MKRRYLAFVAVAACGGGSPAPVAPAQPLSVQEHLAEAQEQEQTADELEASARGAESRPVDVVCGDTVLADQVSSGGERLVTMQPCWTAERSAAERHRATAKNLRADAAAHRERARDLLAAEQASCATMTAAELDHSPFAHVEDVVAVTPIRDSDRLRGARISLRKVEGLTAEWLRSAIACHQARAAVFGWSPKYFSHDPTLVAGAQATVEDGGDTLVVEVRAGALDVAQIVHARAEALVSD